MTDKAKSWRTSVASLVNALGVLAITYGVATDTQVAAISGVALAVFGIVWHGISARDNNVTSEGRVAPKAKE